MIQPYFNLELRDKVEALTKAFLYALFQDPKKVKYKDLNLKFLNICEILGYSESDTLWNDLFLILPDVRESLDEDALAFYESDPACKLIDEVYLAYPGFHAIAIYRLSHVLYNRNAVVLSRMMSEYAHGLTGTDIHPGAVIGKSFFIDHATGIVIGETTIIHDRVKIYQGVTLGGIQVKKSLAKSKRHPTIEDDVVIYANATILGGDVVIGKNSVIGANVSLSSSIPPNTVVTSEAKNNFRIKNKIG